MQNFRFSQCSHVINEAGSTRRLGDLCRQMNIKRPLVITDSGLTKSGVVATLEDSLTRTGLPFHCYSDVIADPPEHTIRSALSFANDCQADAVIGFGGGSSLDTAKLVALLAGSGETLESIYGVDQAKGKRLPLIQVPTTAGTGSEATPVAIVTTGQSTKKGVVARQLYADVAVLDAELTLGLPPRITATTGVDAMVHAIEAYTSAAQKNPLSDLLACQALKLLGSNIVTAYQDGKNLAARQAMLFGAYLAGQAFANAPVAAVHALAYPLGGQFHIPHGLSNALVLPAVLQFNSLTACASYAELAESVLPAPDLHTTSAQRCDQFIDYLVELIRTLELPTQLSELGIQSNHLPALAADAMGQQRLLVNNPRPVTEADALAIYRAIL